MNASSACCQAKVDDCGRLYTLVGSANLIRGSLYINLEFLAVIRSAEMARRMQEICRFELAHFARITMANCRRIGRWHRLINRLAWVVRWWL